MNNSNKRPVESFVVAEVGQTTIPSSGVLSNTSTGAVNLAQGQLGVISSSIYGTVALNAFTDATPTVAEAPVISIVNGTSTSANPSSVVTYPLWNRPFEATTPIDGRGTVIVTKQAYREPEHSVWVIGNAIGQANAINVASNTLYQIAISFRGNRVQEMYGNQEAAYLRGKITTPDFSAAGLNLSTTLAVDYINTYLVWDINRNSQAFVTNPRIPNKAPVVAFLIDTTGTTGTAIGGGTPIAAGDVISVVNTSTGVRSLTLTESMATSIKNAAVAASGAVIASVTWKIMVCDLASAGSATGGTSDMIMIMGLDENVSFVDYVPQVKVSLEVNIPFGFNYNTVRCTQSNYANEGQGLARQLDLLYKGTQGQRKYNLRHVEWPIVEFPSPIVTGQKYVVYNIQHSKFNQVDTSNSVDSPFRDLVCIPAYSTGTTPNPLIATFDGVLNSWLASTTHNDAIITLN